MSSHKDQKLGECLTSLNINSTGLEINVSAPGKVILHGEHSVVYGKLAIATSLGLRTKLRLVEIDAPNSFILELPPYNFVCVYKLDEIKQRFLDKPLLNWKETKEADINWEHPDSICQESVLENCEKVLNETASTASSDAAVRLSIKCIFYLLSGILSTVNIDLKPLCLSLDTELDIGSGTGSSASCVVTIAAGLIQYLKVKSKNVLNISKNGYKPTRWEEDETHSINSFSRRQLDLICKWAFHGEKIIHGTPSGIDNTVCTFGNIVAFRKNTPPRLIRIDNHFNILLINTKVSRKTGDLVAKVARLREKYPSLVNNILNAMDDLANIALHRIMETGEKCTEYFEELGRLFVINHSLLCSLEVSHPKLDEIALILKENGLQGKLTGAGGGGYAIAILPPCTDVTDVTKKLNDKGFGVIQTKLGGEGVTVD